MAQYFLANHKAYSNAKPKQSINLLKICYSLGCHIFNTDLTLLLEDFEKKNISVRVCRPAMNYINYILQLNEL